VWLRSLHTDANYYDDPLSFNPDRWDVSTKFIQVQDYSVAFSLIRPLIIRDQRFRVYTCKAKLAHI
jgi:hypothetical protein